MAKTIDIKLKAGSDLRGILDAGRKIDDFQQKLMASNKWLMQINSELAGKARDVASRLAVDLGAQADKAAHGTMLSAKQIEQAWRKVMDAQNAAADNANKNMNGIASAGAVATKSMSDLGKASVTLGRVLGGLGGPIGYLVDNLLKGGIWAGVAKVIEFFVNKVEKAREAVEELKESRLSEEMSCISKAQKDLSDSFDSTCAAIDKQTKKTESLLAVQKKLLAAEMELQKQRELSNAVGNEEAQTIIEKKYSMRKKEQDADSDEKKLSADYAAAASNLSGGYKYLDDMDKWFARVDKKISEYKSKIETIEGHARTAAVHGSVNNAAEYLANSGEAKDYANYKKQLKELAAARAQGEKNVATMKDRMAGYADTMSATSSELASMEKLREARRIENERYVAEKSAAIDKAEAKEKESVQKAARERAEKEAEAEAKAAEKAAVERLKAETAAAQAAANERERLEKQLHQQRMADLKEEQAKLKEQATVLSGRASAAQSEFDRAFAMYRDPSRAAAEIGEEKDYRADLDRLHKDARRYGGKWRIDELSALMSRGDTQGVSDTLAGWRKNSRFTPEVEAMVRASAAEQTKTTAEDELRKLNDKTASLAADIKTLSDTISTEKSDLSAINGNTGDLAAKLDELLRVKG